MAITKFGNHRFEGVEQIEVSAGIEIGGGQSRGGVQHEQMADAGGDAGVLKVIFNEVGYIEDLAFLVS